MAFLKPHMSFRLGSSTLELQQNLSLVVEALYHLFAREHGMDEYAVYSLADYVGHDVDRDSVNNLSVNLMIESHTLTNNCLHITKNALQDVLAMQPLHFMSLPFSQRFEIAVACTGWPAESFSELLSSDNPMDVITSANVHGKQALHWAAEHFGESTLDSAHGKVDGHCMKTRSYAELASQLIVGGADVHALFQGILGRAPRDPFLCFLCGPRDFHDIRHTFEPEELAWDYCSLSMGVSHWGAMLVSAGQSLSQYAARENRFLSTSKSIGWYSSSHLSLRPRMLAVVEGPRLVMYATTFVTITKWSRKRTHVPGSWSSDSPHNTTLNTIIWTPQDEDQCEDFFWKETVTMDVESKPFLVEPSSSDSLTAALLEARMELIAGTQDDHGPVSSMITRETKLRQRKSRTSGRRRAASMPPSRTTWGNLAHTRVKDSSGNPLREMSAPFGNEKVLGVSRRSVAHKCPFDGRWRTCGYTCDEVSWRRCMRGDHGSLPGLTGFLYGELMPWELKLCQDEDHVEIAERYSRRFRPEWTSSMEDARQRAKELEELKIAIPAMSFPQSKWSLARL